MIKASWPRRAAMLLLLLVDFSTSPAAAHYREACGAKFSVYSGVWSQVLLAQCNYMTGHEINRRLHTTRYESGRTYIVIVWPISAPSVIRLTQPVPCGLVTEPSCAERISGRLYGHDNWYRRATHQMFRRYWQICQSGSFGRDCYRMLGETANR